VFVAGVRLGDWGVVLVVRVCVGVGGVVLLSCACACDLLIFLHGDDARGGAERIAPRMIQVGRG